MKLNWGGGIAIFYTCFVIAMVSMVVKSTFHKPQMVQDNYYEKDLQYEAFRQKRENGNLMKESIKVAFIPKERMVEITFPKGMSSAKGNVTLFRPSNQSKDQILPLRLDENAEMQLPIAKNMSRGLWRVQLDWEVEGKAYFMEESIVI